MSINSGFGVFPAPFSRHSRVGIADERGAVAIVVGIMFMLLICAVGVTVDLSRAYSVDTRAQNALDEAALAASATAGVDGYVIEDEVNKFFNANFTPGYMGTVASGVSVTQMPDNVLGFEVNLTMPTTFMSIFGAPSLNINVYAETSRTFTLNPGARLELAMVLDNTGSMWDDIDELRDAAKALVDILYGEGNESLPNNLWISVIPFDVAVNIGVGRASWMKGGYVIGVPVQFGPPLVLGGDPVFSDGIDDSNIFHGYASNRNPDRPRDPANTWDTNPGPPVPGNQDSHFRVPLDQNPAVADCQYDQVWVPDPPNPPLAKLAFALTDKSDTKDLLDTMIANACTRLNVGFRWGWNTLSPLWQGLWDARVLPLASGTSMKVVVAITDGLNTVFTGSAGDSHDDDSTREICQAMKADDITIYTIGLGPSVNTALLRDDCASRPEYYFYAPTSDDLRRVFQAIGADILTLLTLRLSGDVRP